MISSERVEDAVQPALVGAMIGCLALSLVSLADLVLPGWHDTYLALFCGLVAVEAGYSYRLRQHAVSTSNGGVRFRLCELTSLFVVRQIWGDVAAGHSPLAAGIPRLDPGALAFCIPVFASWLIATGIAGELDRLGEPPEHDPRYLSPQRCLALCVIGGGVLLCLTTGLTGLAIEHLGAHSASADSPPLWNVVAYFLLGVVLVGQVNYTTLQRRWEDHEIAIGAELAGRWLRYSVGLVGVVTVLAFLLPTGRTASLLDVPGSAWATMAALPGAIAGSAVSALTPLLSLLGLHLVHHAAHSGRDLISPPFLGNPIHLHPRHPVQVGPAARVPYVDHVYWPRDDADHGFRIASLVAPLKALLVWSAVVISVAFRLRRSSRVRPQGPQTPGLLLALRDALRQIWQSLRFSPRPYLEVGTEQVQRGLAFRPHRPSASRRLPRLPRLGRFSAREQVLYFYLSILGRAQRKGFARRQSATPYELDAILADRLASAQEDVHRLTEAYVRARYSPRQVEQKQAGALHASWRRVCRALRELKV